MNMQSLIAADTAALFAAEMLVECTIGATKYNVLLDDLLSEESDAFGGPEATEMQRVHFLTSDLPKIENGIGIFIKGKSKIVVSSVTSADGSELIVTVRGD